MPRGRSTFTKRQKEQARQQKQREKADRKSQRKQEKLEVTQEEEMRELRQHAEAQAAMFRMGPAQPNVAETDAGRDEIPDQQVSEGNAKTTQD